MVKYTRINLTVVRSILFTACVTTFIGCKSKQVGLTQESNNALSTSNTEKSAIINEKPKESGPSFYDSDGNYNELKRSYDDFYKKLLKNIRYDSKNFFVGIFVKKYSDLYGKDMREYQTQINNIQEDVNTKLAKYSDESIRKSIEPNLKQQYKTPKIINASNIVYIKDAMLNYENRLKLFIESHKNCYYILGGYEFYLPNENKCAFNLDKFFNTELDLKTYKFGVHGNRVIARLVCESEAGGDHPHAVIDRPNSYSITYADDYFGFNKISNNFKWPGSPDIPGYLEMNLRLDPTIKQSLDRFIKNIIIIDNVTPETMNSAFNQVDQIWSSKIIELSKKENMALGERARSQGASEVYASNVSSSDYPVAKPFVRRQSIWLIAKGDPFKIEVKECYLFVSGQNTVLEKIF